MLRKKIQELEEQLNKSRVSSNEQNQSTVEPYLALSKKKSATINVPKKIPNNIEPAHDQL